MAKFPYGEEISSQVEALWLSFAFDSPPKRLPAPV